MIRLNEYVSTHKRIDSTSHLLEKHRIGLAEVTLQALNHNTISLVIFQLSYSGHSMVHCVMVPCPACLPILYSDKRIMKLNS
jgi:hypothetical protein